MRLRSEVIDRFRQYQAWLKAKKGRKILKFDLVAGMKAFRTDGEGCFMANEFKRILEHEGIELQMTTRDDP